MITSVSTGFSSNKPFLTGGLDMVLEDVTELCVAISLPSERLMSDEVVLIFITVTTVALTRSCRKSY